MTREDFEGLLNEQLESIRRLFDLKNQSYGISDDVFHNFRSTALRVFGTDEHEKMFQVLLTYMDKHLVVLANKGIREREFEERLRDVMVYSLIAIAMGRNYQKEISEYN